MEELRFPEWQNPCRDAMMEVDTTKVLIKWLAAKAAIYQRLDALAGDSDHHQERREMDDTLSALKFLRTMG